MSRPFSYNDENFTVIGNVLFCHIKIKKRVLKTEPIVEIPPKILARMLFTTQKLNKVQPYIKVENFSSLSTVDVCVDVDLNKPEDKKYFLYPINNIYETGSYLVGFFILKDI